MCAASHGRTTAHRRSHPLGRHRITGQTTGAPPGGPTKSLGGTYHKRRGRGASAVPFGGQSASQVILGRFRGRDCAIDFVSIWRLIRYRRRTDRVKFPGLVVAAFVSQSAMAGYLE